MDETPDRGIGPMFRPQARLRSLRPLDKLSRMPKVSSKTHALVALALGILVGVAHAPIYNLSFLSDDWTIIRFVTRPDSVTNWAEVLRDFYTPLFFHDSSPFYRPLYGLSYGLNFWLFGTNPLGYHLTNLALHAVSAFFVYLIALELVPGEKAWGVSVTGGALFALYPIHPEAVTWISGRVDLICAAFYLPALFFFLRWLRVDRKLYLALSLGAFALALASKEMAVTLPGLLFLCALYKGQGLRGGVLKVLPFALLLGAYLAFRTYVLSGVDAYGIVGRDLDLLANLRGFVYRTGHLLLPVNVSLLPAEWRGFFNAFFLLWWVPTLILAGFAYYRGWLRGWLPPLLFALYAVALVPVFKGLRPDPELTQARWLYIPTAFLAILLAYLLWTTFGRRVRLAVPVTVLACAAFFGVLLLNNGPWLRAGEIMQKRLESGTAPDYPLHYKGAHVFVNRSTWVSANNPPFEEK